MNPNADDRGSAKKIRQSNKASGLSAKDRGSTKREFLKGIFCFRCNYEGHRSNTCTVPENRFKMVPIKGQPGNRVNNNDKNDKRKRNYNENANTGVIAKVDDDKDVIDTSVTLTTNGRYSSF